MRKYLIILLLIPLLVSCKHEAPKVMTSEDFTAHGAVSPHVPTKEELDKLPLVDRPFVYIKASDGVTSFSPVVDDSFHKYADVGFYHVFRVTDDITSQLDVYCKVLHDNYKNLKPMVAIDVKENIGVDVYRVFLHSFTPPFGSFGQGAAAILRGFSCRMAVFPCVAFRLLSVGENASWRRLRSFS